MSVLIINKTESNFYNFGLSKYKLMQISIDISYYPLHEEYVPPILSFIQRLRGYTNIRTETNGMSTQVFGEYQDVLSAIVKEMEKSFSLPRSVFILKIINSDLQIHKSSDE